MERIILAVFAILSLSSCSTMHDASSGDDNCVLSIQMINSSSRGEIKKKHGVYIYRYVDKSPGSENQEFFTIVVFRNGKPVSTIGGGSSATNRIRNSILDAQLPNIDYPKLIEDTNLAVRNRTGIVHQILDGSEYQLNIHYEETDLSFSTYELLNHLEFLSEYDPVLNRLKSVIDTVTMEVGRNEIRI